MNEYTPVGQDLEYEAPPSISPVSPSPTAHSPAALVAQLNTQGTQANSKDGVFRNIKKEKALDKEGLPTYDESFLIVDEAPPYLEQAPFSYIEDGDVLVDGVLVGYWNEFITMGVMSFLFDFLGYFLTTILSTSHAARCGSKMGLGLTLIRLGVIIQDELERSTHQKESENFVSILFVVLGAFLSSKALSDYILLRKSRSILRNITDF